MTVNELDSRVAVVHRCTLFRKRQFYSKRLLLGAFASEAARQLTSFFGSPIDESHMISQDVHARAHIEPATPRAPQFGLKGNYN